MKKLEQIMIKGWNECLSSKLYISYLDFLKIKYSTASEKKNYELCGKINELIYNEINN